MKTTNVWVKIKTHPTCNNDSTYQASPSLNALRLCRSADDVSLPPVLEDVDLQLWTHKKQHMYKFRYRSLSITITHT
jgi:hypothetical protein